MASNPPFIDLYISLEYLALQQFRNLRKELRKDLLHFFNQILKFFIGLLGNRIITDSFGFSVDYHSFYHDKRFDDFGRKVKNVETTICVDDQSQLIVSYSEYFGEIHDSKEFRKTLENMDREIVGKFKFIIGDKGYDSEENHYCQKIWSFGNDTWKK